MKRVSADDRVLLLSSVRDYGWRKRSKSGVRDIGSSAPDYNVVARQGGGKAPGGLFESLA